MSDSVSQSAAKPPGLSLRQILPGATFHHTGDLTVSGCAGQWDECRPNDLFVALVGDQRDGHEDAERAIARGATAILSERLLPVARPQCIVDDSRVAFGTITHALRDNPAERMLTVAAAGDDGKSSVLALLESILRQAGRQPARSASPNRPGGCPAWTPPRLANWLARTRDEGSQAALIETRSGDWQQRQIDGARFDSLIMTNVRRRRPGGPGAPWTGTGGYLKPHGKLILNLDDPLSGARCADLDPQHRMTIGIRESADLRATVVESGLNGQAFTVRLAGESTLIETPVPGAAHIYHCLQAMAAALQAGLDPATIAAGLNSIRSLPGRLERVSCGQAFPVFIDQADSPYRLGSALNLLRRHTPGRVICVFSTPAESTPVDARKTGRIAEQGSDIPVISREEVPVQLDYEADHRILDGFERPARAHLIPDRITAIEWALSQAGADDAVLIAGRGDQSICSLEEGRRELTDHEVCQAWLYNHDSLRPTPLIPVVNPQIFRMDDYRGPGRA